LAAASLFSVETDPAGDIVGPAMTVIPVDAGRTVAIVTYPLKQKKPIEKHLSELFAASEPAKKKSELSKVIIERIENFVLAPAFHDGLSKEKTKLILDAYEGTAKLEDGADFDLF